MFYVTAIDGKLIVPVLGPFETHQEALGKVELAREEAIRLDSKAWFYGFGTCKVRAYTKPGKLNYLLGARVENENNLSVL